MVIGNNLLMFFILYLGVRKLAFDDTFLALLFFVRLRNFAFVHNGNVVLGLYDMLLWLGLFFAFVFDEIVGLVLIYNSIGWG